MPKNIKSIILKYLSKSSAFLNFIIYRNIDKVYSSVSFPSEIILTLLPKYSGNLSGDNVWTGIIVVGLSALANFFN